MNDRRGYRRGILSGAAGMVIILLLLFALWRAGVIFPSEASLLSYQNVMKLSYIDRLIDNKYIGEVDKDVSSDYLMAGALAGLEDDYSVYYTKDQYVTLQESTSGEYNGIGVAMQTQEDGSLVIVKCYEDSPAAQAGLLVGDTILAINGQSTSDMTLEELVAIIRDTATLEITLEIQREGSENFEVTVEKTDIVSPSVSSAMLSDQIGYIVISEFTDVTFQQYQQAFAELEDQGMQKLIIDVRNNPGGLYSSVCDVLNSILPEGVMVYTIDKQGNKTEEVSEGETPLSIPLSVLINGKSASSAEIFAGAIKDYEIGTLVGEKTFGKGIVQTIFPLSDGSAVKLTTSKYYTPDGNNIHGIGIQPDVEVEAEGETAVPGEEASYTQDAQLQAAIQALEETP
ncbi:MAG: S41 family peptidase [Lachnospiraceae bacterium]